MSVVSILETMNPVITAPYCIWVIWVIVHKFFPNYVQHLCFVQFLEYRDTLSWHCERIDRKHVELARLIFCMSNTRFLRWKHLTAYCWCIYRVRCYGSFSPFLGHVQTVSVISSCREVCIYDSARTWKHLRQYRPFCEGHQWIPNTKNQWRNSLMLLLLLACLTHWGRDKMAAFSQTTHSIAFSWMKVSEFRLKIHLSFFLYV